MAGRQLVVDACVGRAAGEKSEVAESRYSREVLFAIRDCKDHRLIFNTALRLEWNEHASRLASSFLVYMFQRRRIQYVLDESFVGVMNTCAHKFTDRNERVAFEKDAHVVAAALSSDQIIISNENRLLAQLIYLVEHEFRISSIQWANPATELDDCIDWISAGAPFQSVRSVGSRITPQSHS